MTSQHSKHPDWDQVWEQVQDWRDNDWLRNYFKSHDINQFRDEHGNPLLHYAVQRMGSCATLQLSDLCIDPNIKNPAGQTALQLAQDTQARCLEDLHAYHLCIDFVTASTKPNGLDALFAAIYRGDATLGDTSGVKNDGNEVNAGGWTALHCAVMYDRPHLIRELHQRFPKLDVNYSTDRNFPYRNYSALRLAAKYGHSNCIITLYECFPAIKAGDVLHVACDNNRSACIPTLCKYFPQLTGNELAQTYEFTSVLMRAAKFNSVECIRTLHSCFPNLDPNFQDNYGNTALMAALQFNYPDSLSALSQCFPNIDPNKQDCDGNTALMHATLKRLPDVIPLLHSCFPYTDVNVCNAQGKTALMMASETSDGGSTLIALAQSFPNIHPDIKDMDGNTALMLAVHHTPNFDIIPDNDPNLQNNLPDRSVEFIRCFVDTFPNVDVNIQNAKGDTALMIAIEKNNASLVTFLLERFPNIDPNLCRNDNATALSLALKCTDPNVLSLLCDRCPNLDINAQDCDGQTALMCAVKSGQADAILRLKNAFPQLDPNLTDHKGSTALHYAIKCGHIRCIEALSECFPSLDPTHADAAVLVAAPEKKNQAIDPNLRDFEGYTALMHAAQRGDCAVLTALHAAFPAIDGQMTTFDQETVLMLALQPGSINDGDGDDDDGAVTRRRIRKNIECISFLCETFPQLDPNVMGGKGRKTALMLAVESPDPSSILPLLCKQFPNIDPNLTTAHNETALMMAMRRCDVSCVATLLKLFPVVNANGASCSINPNIAARSTGNTALMLALVANTGSTAACVFEFCNYFPNIDINWRNQQRQTALMLAVKQRGNVDCLKVLLDRFPSIQPDLRDKDGISALMLAVQRNNIDCVKLLLDRLPSIQPDVRDTCGNSALMLAVRRNNIDCVKLLLDRFPSIQPDFQSIRGNSALMLAVRQRNIDMITLLAHHFPNCNVKLCNNDGKTALMMSKGHKRLIIALHHFPAIALEQVDGQTYLRYLVQQKYKPWNYCSDDKYTSSEDDDDYDDAEKKRLSKLLSIIAQY